MDVCHNTAIDFNSKTANWLTLQDLREKSGAKAATEPSGDGESSSDALIQLTIKVWQPFYARPLSTSDAIEIIANASQLLSALIDGGPSQNNVS